jgi:hypothetical protein
VRHLFVEPFDAERNTTIQFLMINAIGPVRSHEILVQGSQYTGGFPEVLFELFGPVATWLVLLIAGLVTGLLLLLVLRAVIEGHFLTAFLGMFVLFGPLLLAVAGMMNFVFPWTYWAKIAALLGAVALERSWQRRGLEVVPWVILSRWPALPDRVPQR